MKYHPIYLFLFASCLLFMFACTPHKVLETNSSKESNATSEIQKKYAEKLEVSVKDIKNKELYEFINDWYAAPYKYAGKTKAGIDCSGFTGVLYATIYKKTVSSSSRALHAEAEKIHKDDLREGDLVFFKIESKTVSHVGVYLQNNKFVHASTKKGVVISDLNEPYYQKCFLSAGRIK